MANVLTPFGFQHVGYMEGVTPSYGFRKRRIALGNTNPIFHGDPVVSLSTGYIAQASSNTVQVAGVFESCEYVSVSQQRKIRSWYWPGSDAQFDVDCYIIDAAGAYFKAQANGIPILLTSVGNNVGFFIATGGSTAPVAGSGQGNTVNQISGSLLDSSQHQWRPAGDDGNATVPNRSLVLGRHGRWQPGAGRHAVQRRRPEHELQHGDRDVQQRRL